ncbi:MAG: ATP synthase F1 subunit delta [Bacteroidetes bacterium]|jgi:F-type H+-transporting ATPase subunit delta|nr:ATP synthase F1 subunit delta [Bacteroidota bacterium]
MKNRSVARRYAQALYEEAAARQQVDAVDADVDVIRDALEASRELRRFFASPVLSRAQKEDVVEALLQSHVSTLTYDFLRLLVAKQREDALADMVQAYRDLRDEQEGVTEALIRSAHPLSEAEQQQLAEEFQRVTGKQVRLQVQQDDTLIGGVLVRIGDTVYDGSVRHQLTSLREHLEHGTLSLN